MVAHAQNMAQDREHHSPSPKFMGICRPKLVRAFFCKNLAQVGEPPREVVEEPVQLGLEALVQNGLEGWPGLKSAFDQVPAQDDGGGGGVLHAQFLGFLE